MAAVDPSRALQEELFCAICLDYFSEPVILSCGHNFCRACIFAYWQGLENRFPCPQCRKRSYRGKVRPNSQLGKVAERAKELASLLAEPPKARADSAACPCSKAEAPGEVCQQHGEPLKLFCQEEEALICVVCDRSKEHRGHSVVPREEAAKEYKTQFGCHLEKLKTERDSRETLAVNQGKKLEMLVGRAETEKQRTVHAFEQLQKILQDRQQHILRGLSKVTSDLRKMQQENSCKIQQGAPLLRELIADLEQKCQQSDTELLKGAKNLLNRCQACNFPKWSPAATTELEERIFHFSRKKTVLWDHMTDTRELLTLDPDSAHPSLAISADRKTASRRSVCPPHRNTAQRFFPSFCVLGSEGFLEGCHQWLVEVKGKCGWALGVAQESVERKKPVALQPEQGIWAVELGPYQLLHTLPAAGAEQESLTRQILVSLDYEAGRLTFTDPYVLEPLFTFRASFTEKLYPFFWLWSPEASVTLCF